MSTCPLHLTPLNGSGDCLWCDFASGQFDGRFEPGSAEERQYLEYKELANRRTAMALDQALKRVEESRRRFEIVPYNKRESRYDRIPTHAADSMANWEM